MKRPLLQFLFKLFPSALLCLPPWVIADYTTPDTHHVINRDVAIIGGGAAGVYAALRLRDHKHSVVVIEPQSLLGGHAYTYITPNGIPVNLGTQLFINTSEVRYFFSRFQIPLTTTPLPTLEYRDFSTGGKVNFYQPSLERSRDVLERYKKVQLKYPSVQAGYFLPYPVPEELLMPFGDFIKRYDLEDILPFFLIVNEGYVPLLELPTIYPLKYLSVLQVDSFLEGIPVLERNNTQELYDKAREELGPDAILNSRVVSMKREPSGNSVVVYTPAGVKEIRAKKILIAAPPESLSFDGMTDDEISLFGQFFYNAYYAAILENTGLPNVRYGSADPNAPYFFPRGSPGVLTVDTETYTNLTLVYYASTAPRPVQVVKADILNTVHRLQRATGQSGTSPKIVAFANHAPYNAMVSVETIKGRFYERLYALQGKSNTFYCGATWQTHNSPLIWKFTEDYVLPLMLRSLQTSYNKNLYIRV